MAERASSESWQLPAPDWIGDLAQLKAQARAELAAAGRTAPPDRLLGKDSTSSLSIEVDVRGRVRRIEVSPLWRGRLQPGRVGAALLDAYRGATTAALEARVIQSVMDDDNRVDSARAGSQDVVPDTEAVLASPDRLFTLRRQGRTVLGITGDATRIDSADAEHLRDEAFDLFRAAGLTTGG